MSSSSNAELRAAVTQLTSTVKELLTKQTKQSQVVIGLRAERRNLLSMLRLEEQSNASPTSPTHTAAASAVVSPTAARAAAANQEYDTIRHHLEMSATVDRAAQAVSTVSNVAESMKVGKDAAEQRALRLSMRVEDAEHVAAEHERITNSVTKARSQDLAELSLSRTQVRRMEAERHSEKAHTDVLRRRISALETEYFTQSKACETLIEEVQSILNAKNVPRLKQH